MDVFVISWPAAIFYSNLVLARYLFLVSNMVVGSASGPEERKWVSKSVIKNLHPDNRFGELQDKVWVMHYFSMMLGRSPCYVEEMYANIP